MIVEFIGMPGAGKTTLLAMVRDHLRESGIHAYSPLEASRMFAQRTTAGWMVSRLFPQSWQRPLLWQVYYHMSSLHGCGFLARRPRLAWEVFHSQRHRPAAAQARERRVLHWFFRNAGSYQFLKGALRPDEALLLDEGFVHRVVQLHVSAVEEPDGARIATYIDLLPRPDLVIHVRAPKEVCLQRIYGRGLWELYRGRDPACVASFVEHAGMTVEMAVTHLKRKGWLVVAVDNDGDGLAAVERDMRGRLAGVLMVGHVKSRLSCAGDPAVDAVRGQTVS